MSENSFVCPNCNHLISFDSELLERKGLIACPECGESFNIFTEEPLGE